MVAYLYDGSEPARVWVEMAYSPTEVQVADALLSEIAKVLRVNPPNRHEFASDWLSLVPHIESAMAIFHRST